MGDSQNKAKNPNTNPILSSLLDFGPTDSSIIVASPSTEERLKKLVKQLEQIHQRIDALSSRF